MDGVLILQAEGFHWPRAAQRTSFACPTRQNTGQVKTLFDRSNHNVSGPAHVSDSADLWRARHDGTAYCSLHVRVAILERQSGTRLSIFG